MHPLTKNAQYTALAIVRNLHVETHCVLLVCNYLHFQRNNNEILKRRHFLCIYQQRNSKANAHHSCRTDDGEGRVYCYCEYVDLDWRYYPSYYYLDCLKCKKKTLFYESGLKIVVTGLAVQTLSANCVLKQRRNRSPWVRRDGKASWKRKSKLCTD